jgi:hypothetical protein
LDAAARRARDADFLMYIASFQLIKYNKIQLIEEDNTIFIK